MKYFLLVLLSIGFIPSAFAEDYAPCGPAGSYVYVGDTQATVLNTCGQPAQIREYQSSKVSTVKKTRWAYTQSHAVTNSSGAAVNLNSGTQYVVEFTDKKISQIYIGGLPYTTFDYCGPVPGIRRSINVGDTMSTVRSLCGPPTYVNEVNEEQKGAPTPAIEYVYQDNPAFPATIVVIENGIVTMLK